MTAAGRYYRKGTSLIELTGMFPDEAFATTCFESLVWPNDRHCPHCGSTNTVENKGKSESRPYRCRDCHQHFSVRIGTVLERSRVPLRKWLFALYLEAISLKGVSSMKLHHDLKVTQKTAWFMLHRIRETFDGFNPIFDGPTEANESCRGGKEKNKHANRKPRAGSGPVGKTAVAGLCDRAAGQVTARVVEKTDAETLQGFVTDHTAEGSTVTDEALACRGLPQRYHEAVKHSVRDYVREQAHTNEMESFWASLRRGYHGTCHPISVRHLQRHMNEFAGRHNLRRADPIDMMAHVAAGMVGKRLMYRGLIADSERSSGLQS